MDHETMRDHVLSLQDPEVSEGERHELTAHLEQCAECRAMLQRWERVSMGLARLPEPRVSEAFVQAVMAHLEPSRAALARRRWHPVRWRVPVLAGGVLAGALFAMLQVQEVPLAIEPLLLAKTWETPSSEWVLFAEPPSTEDVLSLIVEGQ
jgi:anti-sigma factor RsiW